MTKNRFKKIDITFNYDPAKSAAYLCYVARQIYLQYYQKKGFYILPRALAHRYAVYFPDYPYSKTFWKSIQKMTHENIMEPTPAAALREAEAVVKRLPTPKKRENEWKQFEPLFWKSIRELGVFKEEIARLESITVIPCVFGTRGSFFDIEKNGKINMVITVRDERDIKGIVWTVLADLLTVKDKTYSTVKWHEKQEIIDFLLEQTSLSKYFKESVTVSAPTADDIRESQEYVKKLGFATRTPVYLLHGDVMINGKQARRYLSKQQNAVLKDLVLHRGTIRTFDDITKSLWPEAGEEFSLWAVTKVIQKIREKLQLLGVRYEVIHTVRKKGYVFHG